jgi:hypothetical protein
MPQQVPLPQSLYDYRGQRLVQHSGGGSWQRVIVSGPLTLERFPEPLGFSDDPADPWVMLPMSAFDAWYSQSVTGRYRGVPVDIVEPVRSGLQKGRLRVAYAGTHPEEAVAVGLLGNRRDGWEATIDRGELTDVSVDVTRHELP